MRKLIVKIETTILKHLLNDENYTRRTLPYLRAEYFTEKSDKFVFEAIDKFVNKYNNMPTREALILEIDSGSNITDSDFESCKSTISELVVSEEENEEWLLETTEKFCQEKALYNAIMESISIIDSKDETGRIPEVLTKALAISFDPNIGHDFIDDSEERFNFYHKVEERIPFDLDYMNRITSDGLPKKTLNIILAGTGVGKSLVMCHMAAANLMEGKNVLYITLEMAEERIAERIDANLLNVPLDELVDLSKDMYNKKISQVKNKTTGKLIVKEYPTAVAGTGHFRHLINELKLKRTFTPDIVYVDYLNICASSRMKMGAAVNSYTYIKAIAEELRGLAVEKDIPIVSATQTTRSGFSNSDPGLEDTSESFGLPATADFMIALITTEELESANQLMIKQLKNRYNDLAKYKRFVVGIDRAKMRLYDVDDNEQNLVDDTPVMDNSDYGMRMDEDDKMRWSTKKMGRKDFSGLLT